MDVRIKMSTLQLIEMFRPVAHCVDSTDYGTQLLNKLSVCVWMIVPFVV